LRWVNPKAGYVFQIRMIKVENTTQPPPTQFAAIERNFHETQAGQGLRKSHTPKKVGVRFGVRAISLNCVDLRGPNTQKHMYCVEFLRVASRFDSFSKSLSLRVYHYYNFDILNLERPYTSGNRIKIFLYPSLGSSIKGNVPPNKNGRKIELYTETYNVETMTYVAFHEMQHSVQGRVSGLLSALDVYSAETLATGVETFLTRKYYPDYENLTVISATPGATGVEIMTGGYTGLVQDLVDNDNSQEDYCNGFELDKIEADFHSSSPVTWNNWRDEIIANRSTNPTVNKVSDLFAAWKM